MNQEGDGGAAATQDSTPQRVGVADLAFGLEGCHDRRTNRVSTVDDLAHFMTSTCTHDEEWAL